MQNRIFSILFFLVQMVPLIHWSQCYGADSHVRFDTLESFALCYTRPFTALEIAACNGECSLLLAERYQSSVCVAVESNELHGPQWTKNLLEHCIQSQVPNLILLSGRVDPVEIRRLGECEHFDLVYSFWGIERAGALWKEFVDGLLTLGDHLILEVVNSKSYVQHYIVEHGGQLIAALSYSTLYHIPCNKNTLKRKTWLRTLESTITIHSTFTEKKLVKKTPHHNDILVSDWKPGINLITLKMYQGVYPTNSMVKKALSAIKYVVHNDWAMHNIIVQGDSLALIDYGDPRMQGHDQSNSYMRERTYQKIMQCIDLDKPQDVETFYWKYLKTRQAAHGLKKILKNIFGE